MKECSPEIIEQTLTAATIVHKKLGPGLLECVYEKALMIELERMNLPARSRVDVPVYYDGLNLGTGFTADIVVNDSLLLEVKSVDEFSEMHVAQVTTYLRMLDIRKGFLINFNKKVLKHGIKRVSI
jgi:GxxExxY protein